MNTFLLVLIAGVCLIWIAYISALRVETGAGIFLFITYGINIAFSAYALFPIINIGNITIYQQDPIVVILLLAFIFRIFLYKPNPDFILLQRFMLVVFVGLVAFSTLLGVTKYGLSSFVDARRYLVVIAPLLYFVSFKYTVRHLSNLAKMVIVTAAVISLIGLVKWLLWEGKITLLGSTAEYAQIRTVIGISTDGIIILIAWLMLAVGKLRRLFKKTFLVNILLLFFTFMLVLLQERTLWVLACFCLFYFLLLYDVRFLQHVIPVVSAAILVLGFLYIFDLFHIQQTLTGITIAINTIQGENSSIVWRYEGWVDLLKNFPPENYFFGLPFGSGYDREVFNNLVSYNPHNFYITNILRIGIVGMLMFLTSHLHVLKRSYLMMRFPMGKTRQAVAEILFLGIMINLIGTITYNLAPLGGAIWGLAVAVMYTPVKSARFISVEKAKPIVMDL